MSISHYCIDRPIFASVISIIITLAGAVAMHVKVGDPFRKSVPALAVLSLSAVIIAGRWPSV